MNKSIVCIAIDKEKVLIAHRIDKGQMALRWEFPGGKVDEGEDEITAIKREMKEEFSVDCDVLNKITSGKFTRNEKEHLLEVYEIKLAHNGLEKKFVLTEHLDYKWVNYLEIPKDNFVDSDLSIYNDVCEYIKSKLV